MERRRYQRIPVQISAIVTTEDGAPIEVIAFELSNDCLGIESNTAQRNMITPAGSFLRDGRPLSLFVGLNLPDENGQLSKIVARCHVIFSRRVSSARCKIGLRYVDFENNGQAELIRFIERTQALQMQSG